jgi:hypothetical protein
VKDSCPRVVVGNPRNATRGTAVPACWRWYDSGCCALPSLPPPRITLVSV